MNVRQKQEYIQSYSKHFGIEALIRYNTRVEKLEKIDDKWKLASTTLIREGPNKGKIVNEIEVGFISWCRMPASRVANLS